MHQHIPFGDSIEIIQACVSCVGTGLAYGNTNVNQFANTYADLCEQVSEQVKCAICHGSGKISRYMSFSELEEVIHFARIKKVVEG